MKFLNKLKDETGQSIIIFALVVTLLLSCCAIVIDAGYMQYMKSDLQTAADAAALSAAGQFPRYNNYEIYMMAWNYAKKNLTVKKNTYIYINLDRSDGTVEVVIKQLAPKFFAAFVSKSNNYITKRAVAKYNSQWAGESLPFLNLDGNYEITGNTLYVWEKQGTGDFESIDDYEIVNGDDWESVYFQVDYMNGIEIKEGVVAKIRDQIQWIFWQHREHVYIFSLSREVMNRGTVLLTNGTYRSLLNLKNNDIVHPSQLVLVECQFTYFDPTAKKLTLVVQDYYDFYHGNYPDDYKCPGKVAAKLIS